MLKVTSTTEYLATLESACQWLSVESGRAACYGKFIWEFLEDGARSRDHILALGESSEIIDIFLLWNKRLNDYPGLKDKIRAVFRKGPLLREDEKPTASSNRARNDAFVFFVAGKLLKANIPVVAVDGILAHNFKCDSEADITIRSNGRFIDFECKRPQKFGKLLKRAKEARRQIARPSRGGRHGIIALDCSVLVRPAETIYESESLEGASAEISRVLETSIIPKVNPCLTNSILGYLLFARVPAFTCKRTVTLTGKPVLRPDYFCTWLIVSNKNYSGPDDLRLILRSFG